MSANSMSDSDSSEYEDEYESFSDTPAGSNSIADATDGSQSESDENSYDSESDGSQSVSTRSSSSYQTDVTVSSVASDNNENDDEDEEGEDEEEEEEGNGSDMGSSGSQVSVGFQSYHSDGEFTPIEVSSDESDGGANYHEANDNGHINVENGDDIQVIGPNDVPEGPVVVIEPYAQNGNAAPPAPQAEPQPGPSNETDKNSKTAKKRPASEMESDNEDEDQLCPICFDSWKGTGNHRIVSLKCGHLFGKSCVERWLSKNKKCPKCNATNKLSDVRQLFAPTIKVKEAPEEQRLLAELKKALEDKRELELKLLRKEQEVKNLTEKHEADDKAKQDNREVSIGKRVNDSKCQLKLVKSSALINGGGRVMAYCPWNTQLTISRASVMAGFGLTLYNCERDFFAQKLESFHTQPIRDLEYCPKRRNNLLLTCSFDKSAKMIDYRSNSVVQTYRASNPIWSCCWDSTGVSEELHKISLGLSTGEIARHDIRMPSTDPCMVLNKKNYGSGQDITAIPSLVSIPHGFSSSLPRGALVACHLKSCQIFVGDEDVVGVKLPFEGPFSCLKCEPVTGHLLLTTKKATHTVLRIVKDGSVEPANLIEPVLQIDGGNKTQSLLSRSAISTYKCGNESRMMVTANEETSKSVKIWSVSEGGSLLSDMKMHDNVVDICNFGYNNNKYLACLSEKKLNIYNLSIK